MANFTQLNLQGSGGQKDSGKESRPCTGNNRKLYALAGSAVGGLLLSAFLLQTSGCSHEKEKPALVNPSNQISSAQPAMPAVTTPGATTDTKPVVPKKRARRKSSIVTYKNPEYGVSFRYPRNYALKTGDEPQRDVSGLGPVATSFVQPGGVTLAAVEMPRNSSGTDFSSAYFSVSVNPNLTEEQCAQFSFAVPSGPDATSPAASKVKIGLIEYSELENAAKLSDAKYYHVFENGACYEFGLGLGVNPDAADDGVADLNFSEMFGKLEKILATVKIAPGVTSEVATQTPAPAVQTPNQ